MGDIVTTSHAVSRLAGKQNESADGGKFPSNSTRPVQTTRRPSKSEEFVEYIDDYGPLRSSRGRNGIRRSAPY